MSRLCLLTLCVTLTFFTHAQVQGLWVVEKVKVGSEEMTPVARWFRINEGGDWEGGNGWMQNSVGSWEFDSEKSLYTSKSSNGINDQAGPFTVEFDGENKMKWRRQEEGMDVMVSLLKSEKLPAAPADLIQGLWKLEKATDGEEDILLEMDPEGKRFFQVRWDRIYVDGNTPKGKRTGYWHMHGHRAELTLLPHQEGDGPSSWTVETNGNKLEIFDKNAAIELTYVRIFDFPK